MHIETQKPLIVIRKMRLEDIEAVHEVDKLSFSTPWPRRAYIHELTENPGGHVWVAEYRDPQDRLQVVGMIAIWLILDEAHIGTLAVHPQYRRQGIARELIRVALMSAIRKGAKTATLEVRQSNHAAQLLYSQFGFEVLGRRRAYYRDNREDALLMTITGLNTDSLRHLELRQTLRSAS